MSEHHLQRSNNRCPPVRKRCRGRIRAGELTIKASAEALGTQLQQQVTDARQLRDKLEFLWNHIQF